MKKLFILLFPQKEYVAGYFTEEDISLFNDCIRKRYIEKGYDFCIATFKNSNMGIVSLKPHIIVNANITFGESNPYTCKNWKYADFKNLAEKVNVDKYSNIAVGGFHCYDCVEKFANEIYAVNKNVIVDTDLTEMFRNSYRYEESFNIEKFNSDLKLKRIHNDSYIPLSTLEKQKEKYQNPIWGISSKMIEMLESRIQEEKENNVTKEQ